MKRFFLIGLALLVAACVQDYKSPWPDALQLLSVNAVYPDGYDPYLSANLSVTKEIGDHVSLSFFANNFTNARPYRKSHATGVSAIFTPAFYYGLTCRIKL